MPKWRLIPLTGPRDAAWNMACDEHLLLSCPSVPVLRFYAWRPEAISAGYFQDIRSVAARLGENSPIRHVVRRLTGGGLVHHGRDLTVSLVLPEKNPYLSSRARDSYRDVHGVFLKALSHDFPDLELTRPASGLKPRRPGSCFEEPVCFDLCLHGKKILGSSQRRRKGFLLHQSAVFLPLAAPVIASLIQGAFRDSFGVDWDDRPLSAQETSAIEKLARNKYAAPDVFIDRNVQATYI